MQKLEFNCYGGGEDSSCGMEPDDRGQYYLASEVDARIAVLESCARELLAYIEANGTDATAHLLIGKYAKVIE